MSDGIIISEPALGSTALDRVTHSLGLREHFRIERSFCKGKGKTEDKMVGWHDQLSGQVFEQTLEDDEGQRNLACYGTCGHNAIQHLNNNLIYDKCLASYNYLLIK